MVWVIVALVIVVVLAVFAIGQYNSLVRLRNSLQEAWRQVDVELNRRYDLIPNLVEVVKGAGKYEAGTLERVIGLRNQAAALAGSGGATQQRAEVEGELTRAVNLVIATAEAYPELKANANFVALQQQLASTEDRIANSRRYYNAIVGDYNTRTEAFPSNLFAGMFGFQKAGYFEVNDPTVRAGVKVSFDDLGSAAATGAATPPAISSGDLASPVQAPVVPAEQPVVPPQV